MDFFGFSWVAEGWLGGGGIACVGCADHSRHNDSNDRENEEKGVNSDAEELVAEFVATQG